MHKLQAPGTSALRAALADALRLSGQSRYLHRLHAVLLVSLGRSCYEVAGWLGADPRSVERWVHAFQTSDVAGLHDHHHGGRKCRLTQQQLDDLATELRQAPQAQGYALPSWSAKLIARHIQQRYGIELSQRQCQRLFGRRKLGSAAPSGAAVPRAPTKTRRRQAAAR